MRSMIPRRKNPVSRVSESASQDPFHLLHEQMNDLFEDFFGTRWAPESYDIPTETYFPRFDISESDSEITVEAELPGMNEKDVQIHLEGDMLVIEGEKQSHQEEKKRNYHVQERYHGSFRRSLPLPEGTDKEKIKASFSKGLLTVAIPKTEKAKIARKTIPVRCD